MQNDNPKRAMILARLHKLVDEMTDMIRDAEGSISKLTVQDWRDWLRDDCLALLTERPADQTPTETPRFCKNCGSTYSAHIQGDGCQSWEEGGTADRAVLSPRCPNCTRMAEELHAVINEPMYAGTRKDWVDRCYAAELEVERLKTVLPPPHSDELVKLRADSEILHHAGIVEISIRNQSVSDYINHWEGRALKAEAQLAARPQTEPHSCAWKDAILDACVVDWVLTNEHQDNPRRAINDLLAWQQKIALDPAVSKEAHDLHERIKELETHFSQPAALRHLLECIVHETRGNPSIVLLDGENYQPVRTVLCDELAAVLAAWTGEQ